MFGPDAEKLAELLPLFEIVPDWGNYTKVDLSREEYHKQMVEGADLLRALKGRENATIPFHPSPAEYRQTLLLFFELFADLSDTAPDFDALEKRYWQRVYAIYDRLPQHVDPRPHAATQRLIRFFDPKWDRSGLGPLPGRWMS